jgi:hypothetical protein
LILFVLSLGMLVMLGCGADNESEGQQLAKAAGDPGTPSPKGIPTTQAAPTTTQSERYQNSVDNKKNLAADGYPGAKKK